MKAWSFARPMKSIIHFIETLVLPICARQSLGASRYE